MDGVFEFQSFQLLRFLPSVQFERLNIKLEFLLIETLKLKLTFHNAKFSNNGGVTTDTYIYKHLITMFAPNVHKLIS